MTERQKDKATITPEGESLERRIDGVIVRPARPIEDKRGEVTEVYRPSWGVHPDPLVYVYQTTLRPVDTRTASPTHKHLNQLVFSERNRVPLIIPRGVYHAVSHDGLQPTVGHPLTGGEQAFAVVPRKQAWFRGFHAVRPLQYCRHALHPASRRSVSRPSVRPSRSHP